MDRFVSFFKVGKDGKNRVDQQAVDEDWERFQKSQMGRDALQRAATKGNVEAIKKMIREGVEYANARARAKHAHARARAMARAHAHFTHAQH